MRGTNLLDQPLQLGLGILLAERSSEGIAHPPERAAPLSQILRRPGVVAALLAVVASFSVMAGMMTLVGYVLVGHGHDQGDVFRCSAPTS